jgi:hypothetical protein
MDGEVAEIDGQRLVADGIGRGPVATEVDAFESQRVGRDDFSSSLRGGAIAAASSPDADLDVCRKGW